MNNPTPEEQDPFGLEKLRQTIRPDDEVNAVMADIRSREAAERVELLRQAWRVPKRHQITTASRAGEWGKKLAMIESRLGQGSMFGICGLRGGGKTQMAVEAMKFATLNGMSARYIKAVDMFQRIRASFRRDSPESEVDVTKDFRRPKLLVIDELGKRGESDWENNLLFSIIDDRYSDMTDTIMVANLDQSGFLQCIGQSLASRMNETGGMILADWESRR
jgi:DNA replication protein DnaC